MDERLKYLPEMPIPPGETLRETIKAIGMTQQELATKMDRPKKTINEIIMGKNSITADTAIQFERVLGVPSSFWLNLESNFQLVKARYKAEKNLLKESKLIDRFPYPQMAKEKWVKQTRNKLKKTSELLNFFGVVSLKNLNYSGKANYRRAKKKEASVESLTAWLRKGELEAQKLQTNKFNRDEFIKSLKKIRYITIGLPENWAKDIQQFCADCGVALVYVPHLPKTYANGASWWMTPNKAVIQLSIRNRWTDIFWFSFFHEAAHLLKHGKKGKFININGDDKTEFEQEADRWASNFLINEKSFSLFVEEADFSLASVKSFAKKVGVGPDIVVGRLFHEEIIRWNSPLNKLRGKLEWQDE